VVYQVRDSARSVAVGSAEIARGILDLSVRTEEQSANLQSITSAMRELTDGIQHNSRSAQEANQLTTASAQVVARGSGLMGGVVATMGRISASSKKISEIINVIDGIAFQTNILALNAAVEAARAGEQGRGFAVVASEVRLLAQRSATAAKEIKVLVSTSVDTIDAGCVQVNDAGRTMTEIVGAIQSVAAIVNEISSESSVQSASIDDIGRRVQAMDTVTQHNAALVEQGSASSATLRDDAAVLLAAVGTFQLREL
jgi:methyl-accepting chemotaxis protein